MIKEHIPWPWLILGILDDHDGQASLQDIYSSIEEQYHQYKPEGTELTKPELRTINPRYGIRPKYQHTVRGCLSNYKKRRLVDRIDRGVYRLTDQGADLLKWYLENY